MADKRKEGTQKPKRTVVRRRRTTGGAAGRIAVRRDTAPYRSAGADEHAVHVRDQISAALAEGRRLREDIEQRIDRRLQEEDVAGKAAKIITQLTAKERLRAVTPLGSDKGADANRPKSSK